MTSQIYNGHTSAWIVSKRRSGKKTKKDKPIWHTKSGNVRGTWRESNHVAMPVRHIKVERS